MEKKILMAFLFALLLIGFTSAIDITNCTDLQAIGNDSGEFILTNNIDCSDTINWNDGQGFIPLSTSDGFTGFIGVFDGDGYNITNLYINSSQSFVGLFSGISPDSDIKNLGIMNASIYGYSLSTVGALAGLLYGNVSNSYSTGIVTGDYVGGLIGAISTIDDDVGDLRSSYSEADVYSYGYGDESEAGGLVSFSQGRIIDSYATGNVYSNSLSSFSEAGGLAGGIGSGGFIMDSYATGNVEGFIAGGLVGSTYQDNAGIFDSYATGNVNGTDSIGGLVGFVEDSIINTSYATGNVTALYNGGGLVGYLYQSNISNSNATGNVIASIYGGGLTAQNDESIVTNSYATGNVNGSQYVGGFSGFLTNGGMVLNSYSTGNVNGADYIGGLIGYIEYYSFVRNSYSTSSLSCTGDFSCGGLVGYNEGNVYDSYATGDVTAYGSVDFVGGLIGRADGTDSTGTIANSYSTGLVTGSLQVGGLIGYIDTLNNPNANCTNSFWDTETSGQATSACGTGKTTSEMQTQSTFTDAGWDFINTWQMNPTFLYPDLLSNPYIYEVEENPPEEEITQQFPNKITGSGTIYEVMDSTGAGLGKFFDYMKVALPIIMIGLGIVGIVVGIGLAIGHALQNNLLRREV